VGGLFKVAFVISCFEDFCQVFDDDSRSQGASYSPQICGFDGEENIYSAFAALNSASSWGSCFP
jgi:hypothetical protein